MARPNPVLLLRDPLLAGRQNLVSVTSEADPYPGVAVAGSTNEGDLVPALFAHDVTEEYNDRVRIVRAGGPYRTAEWRWKGALDAQTTWRGVDQINYLCLPHDPFSAVSGNRNVLGCCFATRLNRVFLYWATGSTLHIRYRDVDAAKTTWTTATYAFPRKIYTVLSGAIKVLEMPDGSLRMLVSTGVAGAADNDIDVYASTDGLAWTLAARSIVSKARGGTLTISRFRAAASGDWIRVILLTTTTTYALVSSDRGASFKALADVQTTALGAIPTNSQTSDPYGACDLVGLDDAAGTFILAHGENTANIYLRSASRDEDWPATDGDDIVGTSRNVYRLCMARTPTHVAVMAVTWDGGTTARQLEGAVAAVDRATETDTSSGAWVDVDWNGAMGIDSADYMPRSMDACAVDGGFLVTFGLCEPDSSGAQVELGAVVYGQVWTARSMWADEEIFGSGAVAPEKFYVLWDSCCGTPTGWAQNLWTASNGGSSSETWTADYWQLDATANGAAGARSRTLALGAAPSSRWADGAVFVGEWIVRVPTGVVGALADDYAAVRVRAVGASAGVSIDYSVRHSATQVVLWDNGPGVALSTISVAALSTTFHVVRTAITQHDGARWAEVAVASVDDLSAWSTASATIDAAVAGVTTQGVVWGAVNGLSGMSSQWRRFGFDEDDDWNQSGYTQPGSMRGAPVSAGAWYMAHGAWVEWGGGAAFEPDNWTVKPRRRGEVDNLFLPSPQAQWVTTSLASNQVIWDADPDDGGLRFDHDGIAFHGLNVRSIIVKYNNANSGWASPLTQHTLYSDLVTGLTVSAVSTGYIDVTGATLEDGAYTGAWVHYTSGALASASVTIAHQAGNRLYFAPLGWTSVAPATADSLVIHGSVAATLYTSTVQHRYMLWECSGTTTASGDYRVGTHVAGHTTGFDAAAVDWEHVETTVNGTDLTDGVGGVRWGFEATPPRRAWEATARGDASKVRRVVEALLRDRQRLGVYPFTFAFDRDDLPRAARLARLVGDVEQSHAGWRQDTDGTWYPVGDMGLRFEEEK